MTVMTLQNYENCAFSLNFITALGDSICQAIVHNDLKALKK